MGAQEGECLNANHRNEIKSKSHSGRGFRLLPINPLCGVYLGSRIFALWRLSSSPVSEYTPLSLLCPTDIPDPSMNIPPKPLGLALNLIGVPVSVAGDTVTGKAFALQIIPECTPLFMLGLFLCFIVFSPATVRQKASGLLMGIPALYLGNLVRLVAIFMAGQHDRRLFEPVHAFWGQVYAVLLVLLSFILWLKSLR